MNIFWCNIFIFLSIFVLKSYCDSSTESDYPDLRPDWPYCFEFTWFGPDYDNVTRYNGTCADYLDETRADGVPCAAPIVISYDGTLPNMDYLWDKHKSSILCKRSFTQRCIKYTYFFNGKIANVTRKCAKVQQNGGGIIDSGCFKQKLEQGYESEICVCKSTNGLHWPCNRAPLSVNSLGFTSLIILILYLLI